MRRRLLPAAALTLAVYGFAGWLYVAVSAIVVPETLHLPVWHFSRWPREDTFGALCFGVSFAGFFTYQLIRSSRG